MKAPGCSRSSGAISQDTSIIRSAAFSLADFTSPFCKVLMSVMSVLSQKVLAGPGTSHSAEGEEIEADGSAHDLVS